MDKNIQKVLKLILLIYSLYKEPIPTLVAILYNLSKAKFLSKIISNDIDKLNSTIIDKIQKVYIEDKIIQKLFKLS